MTKSKKIGTYATVLICNVQAAVLFDYDFEDAQSPFADNSSNNPDLVVTGSTLTTVNGDRALNFNNPSGTTPATDFALLPLTTATIGNSAGSFTLGFGVSSTDSLLQNGRLLISGNLGLDYNAGGRPGPTLALYPGGYGNFTGLQTLNNNSQEFVITDGLIHWLFATFDSSTSIWKFFVDGQLVDQTTLNMLPDLNNANISNTSFGAKADVTRVFAHDVAWSDAEVLAFSVPEPSSAILATLGLLAYSSRRRR